MCRFSIFWIPAELMKVSYAQYRYASWVLELVKLQSTKQLPTSDTLTEPYTGSSRAPHTIHICHLECVMCMIHAKQASAVYDSHPSPYVLVYHLVGRESISPTEITICVLKFWNLFDTLNASRRLYIAEKCPKPCNQPKMPGSLHCSWIYHLSKAIAIALLWFSNFLPFSKLLRSLAQH